VRFCSVREASSAATSERIRAAFATTNSEEDGADHGISVSVGVVSIRADKMVEIESLMSRADEVLYVAKARGGNRVEVADGYSFQPMSRAGRDLDATGERRLAALAGRELGRFRIPALCRATAILLICTAQTLWPSVRFEAGQDSLTICP
jgi:hypothetical protein